MAGTATIARDRIGTALLCSICEARLLPAYVESGDEKDAAEDLLRANPLLPPPARQKYLYIFSSDGLDYGISKGDPGWNTRISPIYSRQHCAEYAAGAANPGRSRALPVERVEREVYLDARAMAHELSIAETFDQARHRRPHPLFGRAPERQWAELEERLAGPGAPARGRPGVHLPTHVKGTPRRYYLLLSPFRLGPRALKFAKENPDALTLWFDEEEARQSGKISGPGDGLIARLHHARTAEATARLGALLTIPVVDPYSYAERIRAKLLTPIQDLFFEYVQSLDHGDLGGVNPRHFKKHKNRGDLRDLTILAHAVASIQSADEDLKKLVDQKALEEVMGLYGSRLENHVAQVENASRFFANWLTGPQHQVLDLNAVKDCVDREDRKAGVDKASAVGHWFCQFRSAQSTAHGAKVIAQVISRKFEGANPMRDLFLIYGARGRRPEPGSTDQQALHALQDIVPDAALFIYLQFGDDELDPQGRPDPSRSPQKRADALATLVNNVGYFNSPLLTDPATDPDDLELARAGKQVKYIYKARLYAAEFVSKVDTEVARPFRTLETAVLSDNLFARTRQRMLGLDPMGAELKQVEGLAVEAETEADLARRLAEGQAREVRKLEEELFDTRFMMSDDAEPSRINGMYSTALLKRKLLERDLARLDRDLRQLARDLDSSRRLAVGDDGLSDYLRRQPFKSMLFEEMEREADSVRARLADVEREIKLTEDLAEKRSVRLDSARREVAKELEKLKGEAEGTYRYWKSQEATARQTASDMRQTVRRQISDHHKGRVDAIDRRLKGVGATKLFASTAFLALEVAFLTDTFGNHRSSTSKRVWAVLDLGKAGADLARDYLSYRAIQVKEIPATWRARLIVGTTANIEAEARILGQRAGALGVVGGLYTFVKYGVEFTDALDRGDTDFAVAAGITAMAGAVIAIVGLLPLLGWFSAGAAWLGPVGAIAGLAMCAGIVVMTFVKDSEWESFLKNCYFANDSKFGCEPNHRFDEGPTTFLGPADPAAPGDTWGVREQVAAFERLRARPEIYTRIVTTNFPNDPANAVAPASRPGQVTWNGQLTIDLPGVAPGSSINYSIRAVDLDGRRHELYHDALAGPAFNRGIRNDAARRVRTAFLAPPDRGGYLVFLFEDQTAPFFKKMVVEIEYTLPDGSILSATHTVLELTNPDSPSLDSPDRRLFYAPNEFSTFANDFSEVPATVFS